MASEFIGAIVGAVSGHVYSIINPSSDAELDNPRLLQLRVEGESEAMTMVKIPRGDYMGALSMDDVAAIIQRLQK